MHSLSPELLGPFCKLTFGQHMASVIFILNPLVKLLLPCAVLKEEWKHKVDLLGMKVISAALQSCISVPQGDSREIWVGFFSWIIAYNQDCLGAETRLPSLKGPLFNHGPVSVTSCLTVKYNICLPFLRKPLLRLNSGVCLLFVYIVFGSYSLTDVFSVNHSLTNVVDKSSLVSVAQPVFKLKLSN